MPSILIVDDSLDSREFCGLIVEMHNVSVRQAQDVPEAMEILDQGFKPDVVLVDLIMPGPHPHLLIKRVKEDETLQNTKVVMMSATPDVNDVARSLGADEGVHKPFPLPAFVDALGLKGLAHAMA